MFTKYGGVKRELKCPSPIKITVIKHFSNSHKLKIHTYLACTDFGYQQLKGYNGFFRSFQHILYLKEELLLCLTIYILP